MNCYPRTGEVVSLTFMISQFHSTKNSQKIDIDMTCFEIISSDDMKNKVLRIIREALASDDLIS